MLKSVRNSAGNVLLQILAATAVMSTSFYFLTNYVIGQKEQVGTTVNLVNLRFALNSAMDYVIFGVRQKYCFTTDYALLNDSPEKCNLQHSGNIERLLMSVDQEKFIQSLLATNQSVGPVNANEIRLTEIHRLIDVSVATTEHPLFPVLSSLKTVKGADGKPVKVGWISVDIFRDNSAYLPKAGNEVYLKIKVALKEYKESEPLAFGRTKMELTSQVVIYPREVGSFALLVPGDLHLDLPWDASMTDGNVSLHKFASRNDVGTSPGLVFNSPVFVNKDIYLPVDNGSEKDVAGTTFYSAVTFADRVYLGNGWVKRNSDEKYAPRSLGGLADRYWADARTFGGFLKGIENDGGLDKGLEVFKKGPGSVNSGALASSMEMMKKCIDFALSRAKIDEIKKSELGARITSETNTEFDYRITLSKGNEFSRQWNSLRINKTAWADGKVEIDQGDIYVGGAVVQLRINVGGRYVEFQLPRNGYAKITAPVGSPTYENGLLAAKQSAETKYNAALTEQSSLNAQLTKARADLKTAEAKLAEEEAKPERKVASTSEPAPADSGTATPQSTPTEGATTPKTTTEKSTTTESGTTAQAPESTTQDPVEYQDPVVISNLEKQIASLNATIKDLNNNKIPAQDSVVNLASKEVDMKKADYNGFLTLKANPPVIEVDTSRVKNRYDYAYDKLDLDFEVANAKSFLDANGNLVAPVVKIQAYDATFYRSEPIYTNSNDKDGDNLLGYLNFGFNASKTYLDAPESAMNAPNSTSANPVDDSDYTVLAEQCEAARNASTSQSFGGAGWSTDFSASTRISWNFAGTGSTKAGQDPALNELIFSNINALRSNATFQVRSIVGKCTIKESAEFVTGFFGCDSLEIEARTKPLRIIGTFIVGKMRINSQAIKAGISWSSIYHPQSTVELRNAGILRSFSGRACDAKGADPIWHPIPSAIQVADRMGCNSISLRAKADPFQWTSVDPDCGLVSNGGNSSNTTCKRRMVRFFVVEQSREGGI
ncbi:hypothetical protein [Bdellovibrio bacteriovorus]|uniref:hypothetical protein n=1 Tax=Bdellovibrio bacteriovorus TaxID=959 RepID=UPI0035A887BF